jgi:hypothetical protein
MRGVIARPYHLDEDREKIDVVHTWQSQTPASGPVPFGDADRYQTAGESWVSAGTPMPPSAITIASARNCNRVILDPSLKRPPGR